MALLNKKRKRLLWSGIIGLELLILGGQITTLTMGGLAGTGGQTDSVDHHIEELFENYFASGRELEPGLTLIRSLYLAGRFDEAMKIIEEILTRENLSIENTKKLLTLRAMIQLEEGNEEGALDSVLLARGISPDSEESRNLKKRLKKEGLHDILKRTLEGDPSGLQNELGNRPFPAIQKGERKNREEADPAIKAILGKMKKSGETPSDLEELAQLYSDSGRKRKALETLNRLLQRSDLDPEKRSLLYRKKGLLQLKSGDQEGAFKSLLQAAGIDPASDLANNLRKKFEKEGFERSLKRFLSGDIKNEELELQKQRQVEKEKRKELEEQKKRDASTEKNQGPPALSDREKKIEVDRFKGSGIESFRKGNYGTAIQEFRKALEIYPDDPELRYMLGRALAQNNQLDDALVEIKKAIELNPDNARFHFHAGLIYFRKGDYERSTHYFETATIMERSFYEAFYNLGVSQEKLGQQKKAARSYEITLEGDPSLWQAALNLAIIHKKTTEDVMALEVLDQAIKANPGVATLHYQKGEILSSRGKSGEAILSLKKAVDLDPSLYEGWFNLGINEGRQGMVDDATSSLNRAMELKPRDPAPVYEMGRLLARQGLDDRAIETLERVLTIQPGHRNAAIELVPLYLKKNRQTDAKDVLDAAIQKSPGDVELYFNRGNLLRKLKEYDPAIESYEKAISLRPTKKDSYRNLAELHREFGANLKAAETYERMIQKTGPDPIASRDAGLLFYKYAETADKARLHLEEYLKAKPDASDRSKIQTILDSLR